MFVAVQKPEMQSSIGWSIPNLAPTNLKHLEQHIPWKFFHSWLCFVNMH